MFYVLTVVEAISLHTFVKTRRTIYLKRRRGWQRMGWLDSITNSMDMNLGRLREMVRDREAWRAAWGCQELDTTWGLKNKNKG